MSTELNKMNVVPSSARPIHVLVAEDEEFPAMMLANMLAPLTKIGFCFWRVIDGKNAQDALMGRKFTGCKLEGREWQEKRKWTETFFWGAVLDCQMPRREADVAKSAKEGIIVAKHIRAWEEKLKNRGISFHTYLFAHSSDNYPEFSDKTIFDGNLKKGFRDWATLFAKYFPSKSPEKQPVADEKEK